jgi:RNA polymerase sigma-70 factor (ECF subfamily)
MFVAAGNIGRAAAVLQNRMSEESERRERFRQQALPHLDAAYNFARWLVHDDIDAEDVVQDAFLRAFRSFGTLREDEPRAWLMAIVRNAAYDFLRRRQRGAGVLLHEEDPRLVSLEPSPEAHSMARSDARRLARLIAALPAQFREVLVLREQAGLAYHEIAATIGAPIGTVMSRLARARRLLAEAWEGDAAASGERRHGV